MKCPGCNGKCWVDSQTRGPTICPVCNGAGTRNDDRVFVDKEKKYDQDKFWVEMIRGIGSTFDESLKKSIESIQHKDTNGQTNIIVHLLTKQRVTPSGDLLMRHVLFSRSPRLAEPASKERLIAKGYAIEENGRVKTVNDVPVGPFYEVLTNWGDARIDDQSLSGGIVVDVNRKGSPYFMDDTMVAFGAPFSDVSKIEPSIRKLQEKSGNIIELVGLFRQ